MCRKWAFYGYLLRDILWITIGLFSSRHPNKSSPLSNNRSLICNKKIYERNPINKCFIKSCCPLGCSETKTKMICKTSYLLILIFIRKMLIKSYNTFEIESWNDDNWDRDICMLMNYLRYLIFLIRTMILTCLIDNFEENDMMHSSQICSA